MGKIKHLPKIKKLLKDSQVFSVKDVVRIVGKKEYAYLLVHNLYKKGEIKRIAKGFYSWSDDPTLAVFYLRPAYLGLQEALSLYGLWEQETVPVIITSKKKRVGIRKVFNNNIFVRRINRKYFFGIDYIKYHNFFVPVSDVEKTLIDFVYFKEAINKEVLKKMSKQINSRKLNRYLKKYQSTIKNKIFDILKAK